MKLHPENTQSIQVSVRIIEVPQNDTEESTKITRTNNTQNRIDSRDFVSQDPEQRRLQDELLLDNIYYHYKSGDIPDPQRDSFDLSMATVARACIQSDVMYCVLAKREISTLYADITKPPYKILFNGSLQTSKLHWEIRILRIVEKWNSVDQDGSIDRERLLVTHGNRFLLFLVFRLLALKGLLYEKVSDKYVQITYDYCRRLLGEYVNKLYGEAVLGTLFKNTVKCRDIYEQIAKANLTLPEPPVAYGIPQTLFKDSELET